MTIRYFFSLVALLVLSASCEKVIDININDANPIPVIESYMENDSTCYALVTYTSNFFDNSSSPAVTDAVLTITDDAGNSEQMAHEGNGIYRGNTVVGVIGRTYTLSVGIAGETYTATSTMPPLVPIDSFTVQALSGFFGGGSGPERYWAYVNYTDPNVVTNYYAVRTTYYDSTETEQGFVTDYRIADDDLSDGIATRSFATTNPFFSGDTITTELASLDQQTHLYFKTLQDALTGGFGSAAPSNPTTNFSAGALGYFGAWSKETRIFIIP
ncbi:MAG: DUF4249 domain-containing protein [Aureispira sp.]